MMDINPLMIDHVVETVLLNVDSELLGHHCKIFRLVCKDWCRVATKCYKRHRGKISFKKGLKAKAGGTFIRIMKTSALIPFDKFAFSLDGNDSKYFGDVLHVCSSAISTLNLKILNLSPDFMFPAPTTYPYLVLSSLRKLVFHVSLDKPAKDLPSLLLLLFQASPYMHSLNLHVWCNELKSNPVTNQAKKAFGDVLAEHFPESVRDLKVNMTLTEEQLSKLSQKDLKITNLDIYFQQSSLSHKSIEQFFEKVSSTLLISKVVGNQFLNERLRLPTFPKLHTMTSLGTTPATIQYRKLFPALKKLEVSLLAEPKNMFSDNYYSSTVVHLDIPNIRVWTGDIIVKISQCYPNLRVLTGVTFWKPEAIQAVFQNLINLEKLEITLGAPFQNFSQMDSLLTGAIDCNGGNFEDNYYVICRANNPQNSIVNLQKLRVLSITAAPFIYPSRIKLTDASVTDGIMKLPNLLCAILDYFPISNYALENLQKTCRVLRPD